MPGLGGLVLGGSGPGGCLVSWDLVPGGLPGKDPPMATAAGGMHPTRMHSCLAIFLARTYE